MKTALRVGLASIVAWGLSGWVSFGIGRILMKVAGQGNGFAFPDDISVMAFGVLPWLLTWTIVGAVAGWTSPADARRSAAAFGAAAVFVKVLGMSYGWRMMATDVIVLDLLMAVIGALVISGVWLFAARRRSMPAA